MSPTLTLSIRNETGDISRLLDAVAYFCTDQGVPNSVTMALSVAIEELVANTINHGLSRTERHAIVVRIRRGIQSIRCGVHDDGRPFNPTTDAPPPDFSTRDRPVGGVGLHLVKTLTDSLSYRRLGGCNHTLISKRLRSTHEVTASRTPRVERA